MPQSYGGAQWTEPQASGVAAPASAGLRLVEVSPGVFEARSSGVLAASFVWDGSAFVLTAGVLTGAGRLAQVSNTVIHY